MHRKLLIGALAAFATLALAGAAQAVTSPDGSASLETTAAPAKAGTATKMVLNMLSTGAMIRLGKTFGNLMVDLRASNTKLNDRARRIVRAVTKLSDMDSERLLKESGGEVKTAIVRHYTGDSSADARQRLVAAHGHLRTALKDHLNNNNGPTH